MAKVKTNFNEITWEEFKDLFEFEGLGRSFDHLDSDEAKVDHAFALLNEHILGENAEPHSEFNRGDSKPSQSSDILSEDNEDMGDSSQSQRSDFLSQGDEDRGGSEPSQSSNILSQKARSVFKVSKTTRSRKKVE